MEFLWAVLLLLWLTSSLLLALIPPRQSILNALLTVFVWLVLAVMILLPLSCGGDVKQ